MSERIQPTPYVVRVRFAEGDAYGEVQVWHLESWFDSALADAFKQAGIDWRAVTRPDGSLRLRESRVVVNRSGVYDELADVRFVGGSYAAGQCRFALRVDDRASGDTLAEASLVFVPRLDASGAPRAPGEALMRGLRALGCV